MKKFLLSLLAIVGLTISFSSASNFTVEKDGSSFSPSSITVNSDYTISSSNVSYSCPGGDCLARFVGDGYKCTVYYQSYNSSHPFYITVSVNGGPSSEKSNCTLLAGTYAIEYFTFDSFTLSGVPLPSEPVLSGGTSKFTPIITGLTTSINEFIPYVVYIGLAVLGAVIGFVAVKWLLNRVRAKIFGTFSGGRRR